MVSDPELWGRVKAYDFPWRDEMDSGVHPRRWCQSFEQNLRKASDWTDLSAQRIVEEYRKFLYLKALDGGALTPPEAIDEAWHLHLSFVQHYARFCIEVLQRTIVHDQSLSRRARLAAYRRLLTLYDREFELRPQDIWPDHGSVLIKLTAQPRWSLPWFVLIWMPAATLFYVVVGAFAGWPLQYGSLAICLVAVVAFFFLMAWHDSGPDRLSNCG